MKTVSATEAKNRLGALIGDVAQDEEGVVIENHGTPRAVLISYDVYRQLLEAREQQQRREAMEALRQLRAEVRARNQDLDEEGAARLIEEVSAEVREGLAAQLRSDTEKRVG